jgi:predicted nucleic acid-binding protein
MNVVVDASVALKWLVPEDGSDAARALLAEADTLVAPELFAAECTNILWKKVRRGELQTDEAVYALGMILSASGLALVPMSPALAEEALGLAITLDHSVYDCLYLALALSRGFVFVTADARFADKVRRHGVTRVAEGCRLLGRAGAA